MDFKEIAMTRQSCRKYDTERKVEDWKLDSILEVARLAPSACNGQPYHITVCRGDIAREAARATQGMGMNGFASDADVIIVISEEPYLPSAALGAKVKGIDYRSIDIGILAAYITAEATVLGLGSCILGWLDKAKLKLVCSLSGDAALVISLGYPPDSLPLREKKRKPKDKLVTRLGE